MILLLNTIFGPLFVKQFALLYQTIVLSVSIGVLWPNGWLDQDETWNAGRPRPRPHCVGWRRSPLPLKGHSPAILAHVYCGQTAGWIKMPLGTEVGLSPDALC